VRRQLAPFRRSTFRPIANSDPSLLAAVIRPRNSTGSPSHGGASFFGAPGRAHSLGGESPLHSRHGQVLAEGNGFPGDRESEGSRKQSAGATNRKRIEAALWGQQAKKC
jgi:hypothetical protein